MMKTLYTYAATVLNIHDGDTITVMLDKGHGVFFKVDVRMLHYNSAEVRTKDPAEKEKGEAARDYLTSLILNKPIYVVSKEWDKYGGRCDGEVYLSLDDEKSVNQLMLDTGHGKPYEGIGAKIF
jgi:endonuclease YncB( thermonuclease family)